MAFRQRAAAPEPERPSAEPAASGLVQEAEATALHLRAWAPETARSAAEFAALALAEPAASAAEVPQPVGVAWVAAAELPEGVAAPGVRVLPREAAGWAAAAEAGVVRQAAAAVAAQGARALPREAAGWAGAAEVVRQAAAAAVPALAARPSAAAWAFRRGRVLPWPAPQPGARFARATRRPQIAVPSTRSWQAAAGEGLS